MLLRSRRQAASAAGVAASALVALAVVGFQVARPVSLMPTDQDAVDQAARLQPVKRISIFDQWSTPNKPSQEDFKTENPSYEYVKKYVTTGRRYDATVNQQLTQKCSVKCQQRPGYNPSNDVVKSCLKFCERLYNANDPMVVTPQPHTRSWWRRKADSFVPGGRYVHYVANPFGGGAPAMNGEYVPDPYNWAKPMGSGESTAWISTVEGRAGVSKEAIAHAAGVHTHTDTHTHTEEHVVREVSTDGGKTWHAAPDAPPHDAAASPLQALGTAAAPQQPAPDALGQDGPPLTMSTHAAQPAALKGQRTQALLLTGLADTAASGKANGLEAVNFGPHTALRDLDDYFDTLPTKDCNKPTCSYVDVRKEKTKTLVKKGHKFTTKDIEQYEKSVLGYHRRHEQALTSEEMHKIGAESARLVDKSVNGYKQLIKHANTQGATVSSDAAFRSQHHSAAYEQATKAKGFVGYYQNVFADAAHPPKHPEQRDGLDGDASRAAARNTRLNGADALEKAKEILEHDTLEAKQQLASQELRFKSLLGAKLKEEQTAVALAAHKINELKAQNHALERKDSVLAKEDLQEQQVRGCEVGYGVRVCVCVCVRVWVCVCECIN